MNIKKIASSIKAKFTKAKPVAPTPPSPPFRPRTKAEIFQAQLTQTELGLLVHDGTLTPPEHNEKFDHVYANWGSRTQAGRVPRGQSWAPLINGPVIRVMGSPARRLFMFQQRLCGLAQHLDNYILQEAGVKGSRLDEAMVAELQSLVESATLLSAAPEAVLPE